MQIRSHALAAGEVSRLAGLIYGSTTEPANTAEWLRLVNDHVHGAFAHVFTRHTATGAVLQSQISHDAHEGAHRHYTTHWAGSDPRLRRLGGRGSSRVLRCHEHFDEAFVAGSSFYQDFLIPHGLRWSLVMGYDSAPGVETFIVVMRTPDQPTFESWTAATLLELLPHFEQAAAIGQKLEQQARAVHSATELLRLLPTPCLFTDQAGRCLEGNEAFSRALEPLSMRLITGRVRFNQPDLQRQWAAALFDTHATALPQKMPFTDGRHGQWMAHLIPWHALTEEAGAVDRKMILVVFDEKTGRANAPLQSGSMASTARLTRAEMEVLAGLLKGLPAKAIASRRSASVNTVRSQIVAILEKTGYNSQKELMASFSNSTLPDSAFPDSVADASQTSQPHLLSSR